MMYPKNGQKRNQVSFLHRQTIKNKNDTTDEKFSAQLTETKKTQNTIYSS